MSKARALKTLVTEDWKTASVRPKDFPPIKAGTIVNYLGKFNNHYGTWAKVQAVDGHYPYYVSFDEIEILNE